MKETEKNIRNALKYFDRDVDFKYLGKKCSICVFSSSDISVTFGDITKDYRSAEEVLKDKIWNGVSLEELLDGSETVLIS